jgi:CDP-diacylglycerol--serine O-phosphatidyltransferase
VVRQYVKFFLKNAGLDLNPAFGVTNKAETTIMAKCRSGMLPLRLSFLTQVRHFPNLLTLANLFCGCCALVFTLAGDPVIAAWFTLGSFLFDYGDGMMARALGVSSPLGKELDSLADVVSFGVVPGAMMFQLLTGGDAISTFAGAEGIGQSVNLVGFPAFILSAFSGLRLGRFNLDTRQTTYFIGLSTPACTVFVLGLTLAAHHNVFGAADWIHNTWLLYMLVAVLSWLLNSEIPMFGMKVKQFDLRSNRFNLLFLGLFIVLVFLLRELALSAIILIYIVLSLFLKNKIVAA